MGTRRKVVHRGRVRSATQRMPAPKRTRKSAARNTPETGAILERLAARCRELREAQGLTQQAAAEKARTSITYLQVVESGRGNPSLAILAALARAYGMTLAELFAGV